MPYYSGYHNGISGHRILDQKCFSLWANELNTARWKFLSSANGRRPKLSNVLTQSTKMLQTWVNPRHSRNKWLVSLDHRHKAWTWTSSLACCIWPPNYLFSWHQDLISTWKLSKGLVWYHTNWICTLFWSCSLIKHKWHIFLLLFQPCISQARRHLNMP